MLRFTVLAVLVLCATLGTPVAAGPTIRRDDTSNAVLADVTTATETKPTPAAGAAPAAATNEASPGTTTQGTSSAAPSTTTTTTTTVEPTSSSAVTTTKKPRKTITFDQRQEGEYNIRADLENFVIVVVPSGSSSGASLLDLLTRSAIQKKVAEAAIAESAATQYHHHHHHHLQRKQQSSKRKNNKAHSAAAGHKKVPQPTPEVIVLDEEHGQRAVPLQVEEFIEGRTPYKVDLSSASARSADHVAPKTGAYPSFSDSVPSGSEQQQARAIVASVVRFPDGSGNYQRQQQQQQQQQLEQPLAGASSVGSQQYGRALPVAGYGTNLVAASRAATNHNNLLLTPGDGDRDSEHHAADAADGDDGDVLSSSSSSPSTGLLLLMLADPQPYGRGGGAVTDANGRLPPVVTNGSPSHESTSTPIISPDSLEYEPLRIDVDMTQLKLQPDTYDDEGDGGDATTDDAGDEWDELRLLGATEQCGPDRRRDSYGVCQFVRS
ncbi:phospholipase D A isoform X1 [Anopheles aquasalis]|uniref:phospholipase D A isoform X1 n=1 Tax=Anopheles aquasalis TaxID=42839 RepID=UPI00215A95A4|nr:phospholipase D A isoform X1 [Anopheles aquasalis]